MAAHFPCMVTIVKSSSLNELSSWYQRTAVLTPGWNIICHQSNRSCRKWASAPNSTGRPEGSRSMVPVATFLRTLAIQRVVAMAFGACVSQQILNALLEYFLFVFHKLDANAGTGGPARLLAYSQRARSGVVGCCVWHRHPQNRKLCTNDTSVL